MAEEKKTAAESGTAEEKKPAEKKENAKKSDKLDKDGLTAKGKENEAIEAAMEEEMDDDEAGDLILEDERISIPLTAENTVFTSNASGLVSLKVTQPDGKVEEFERVVAVRCFPVTNPDEFVSVREPDTKRGRGKEIGMIRRMKDMPEEAQKLLNEELSRRYFTPEIKKITGMKEKFGYSYWDVETTAGKITFVLNNPFSNIRVLEDNSVFINDIDGNCFKIANVDALDPVSLRKIEVYL